MDNRISFLDLYRWSLQCISNNGDSMLENTFQNITLELYYNYEEYIQRNKMEKFHLEVIWGTVP